MIGLAVLAHSDELNLSANLSVNVTEVSIAPRIFHASPTSYCQISSFIYCDYPFINFCARTGMSGAA
jgi:hypothetical protein